MRFAQTNATCLFLAIDSNSEKRKEKSRDAARCRRSKESEIFNDMASLLPVPASVSSQLDKASVMRLAIAFLKTRYLMADGPASGWREEEDVKPFVLDSMALPQALGGVLMALSAEGDIVYLTDSVTRHLGLSHVDVMGQSIYDFSHPCDHDEIREALTLKDGQMEVDRESLSRSFFLRLKSTLASKSRSGSGSLKAASYKVLARPSFSHFARLFFSRRTH